MYSIKPKLLTLIALLFLLSGCAFFNALYNGWQAFNKGYNTETDMFSKGHDSTQVQNATKSDYERAVAKADKAISYYPKANRTHDDAFFLKGRAYFQMARFAEAIPVFKTLQEYYPESKRIPLSWLYLAQSYAGNGNFEAADEAYVYILETYPELNKNQEILVLRADLAVKSKGKAAAIRFLEDALADVTNPARKIYLIDRLAELYIELSMYDKALEYLKQIPPFDKEYKDLYYTALVKKGTCHKKLEQFDEAEAILQELLDSRYYISHHTDLRYELASLYYDQNKIEEARKIYENLVEQTTGGEIIAQSWYMLSLIQIDIDNDLEKGKLSLEKVLELTKETDLEELAQKRLNGLTQIAALSDSLEKELPDSVSEWDIRFKIGERYWLDVAIPDSALVQYSAILEDTTIADSLRVKSLFAKGWILQEMKKDTVSGAEIFNQLIDEYPAYAESKEAQRLLDIPITLMTRRDSALALFAEAEKFNTESDPYGKDVYYAYSLVAVTYPDLEDIAAKALYAAGNEINQRNGDIGEIDTAAARVFGRLCHDYPESEQCRDVQNMIENGKVKGFIESYYTFLESKEKESEESDSTSVKESTTSTDSTSFITPIEIPDFSDWF